MEKPVIQAGVLLGIGIAVTFFFIAEDGIRVLTVTGVQTCALPISGLELDTRDGQAFVSLVAFDFLDARVFGIPWPGYRNFAELNLRFYVRQGEERGVVFLREFVPQRLVAFLARTFYNEPYVAAPLVSGLHEEADGLTIEHRLRWAGRTHTIAVKGTFPAQET